MVLPLCSHKYIAYNEVRLRYILENGLAHRTTNICPALKMLSDYEARPRQNGKYPLAR